MTYNIMDKKTVLKFLDTVRKQVRSGELELELAAIEPETVKSVFQVRVAEKLTLKFRRR